MKKAVIVLFAVGIAASLTLMAIHRSEQPPLEAVLSDHQVADALTDVFASRGNQGGIFDAGHVGFIRANALSA